MKAKLIRLFSRAAMMLLMLLTTLTAGAETYTVTFNANGGEGTMETQTFTAGEEQRLTACTFSCEGYQFKGWSTTTDGTGTRYEDEQSITLTSDITLYAVWGRNTTVKVTQKTKKTKTANNSNKTIETIKEEKKDQILNTHEILTSHESKKEYEKVKNDVRVLTNIVVTCSEKYQKTKKLKQVTTRVTTTTKTTTTILPTNSEGTIKDVANSSDNSNEWAGIICEGNATLYVEGENYIEGSPAIQVPEGSTLTIKGEGTLVAVGGENSAAIGGGPGEGCGNIIIEGGSIIAIGGEYAAAIGGSKNESCGDISIGEGVTAVIALAGENAEPIGSGENGTCGTVTTASSLNKETEKEMVIFTNPTEYNLWIGDTQVTALNRTDILGDSTAMYNPETQTLTLDHPKITTTSDDAAIRAIGIDLKVKGYYKMTVPLGSLGLSVTNGTLTMEGDFTFRGSTVGVSPGSSLSVKGNLRAYGGTLAIANSSSMTLQQGFFGETRVEENGQLTHNVAGYARGDGTEGHPFEISNSSQWQKACADVANGCATAGKHFKLVSGFYATEMMGTADNPFAGIIDGQRQYFIVQANIGSFQPGAALFPYVSGATIKNLLVKGDIVGGELSSGIVGKALSGETTLENCVFDGMVTALDSVSAENWIVGAKAEGATVTTTNCLDVSLCLWGSDNVRAYKLTGGNGVSITQTGTTGLTYDGAIYAPKDVVVTFTASGGNGAYAATVANTLSGPTEGVYSLTVPEENVAIVPNDAVTYTITSPGNITGGNVHTNKTEASAGAPVYISVTRNDYYLLKSLTVMDADDNEIAYDEYGFFHMPASAVTVTAEFVKKYTFENGVLTLKYGTFNNISGNNFDTDVTEHKSEVTKITADPGVHFTGSVSGLFDSFTNCTEIDLSNVETSEMTITANMFGRCGKLEELYMYGWDTSNVKDMSDMFYGCGKLGELDLSNFSFDAVTNANGLFDGCGVYVLSLPTDVAVTKEMRLMKGNHEDGTTWSGWQKLGDASVVSTFEQDANDPDFTYAVLPKQTEASTFVWKQMPSDFVLELPDGWDNRDLIALWDGMTVNAKLTGRVLYKDGDWNTLCLPFYKSGAAYLGNTELMHALGNDYIINILNVEDKFNSAGESYPVWDPGQDENDYPYQTGYDDRDGTLRLYFYGFDKIYAGKPCLIKWSKPDGYVAYNGENAATCSDIVSPTFNGVTITKTMNDDTSEDGKVKFVGTYDCRKFPAADKSILFLGASNTLYYPGNGASIGSCRAYFQLNDPNATVKEFRLNFGEDDDADAIGLIHNSQFIIHNEGDWYDLNGRKLSGKPNQKGIYIINGQKVVVK